MGSYFSKGESAQSLYSRNLAAGTAEAFEAEQENFRAALAHLAGVAAGDIALSVTAASVRVDATIVAADTARQPYVIEAAVLCNGGYSPMQSRRQPY